MMNPLERAKEQAERTGTRTRSGLRGRIQVKRERLGLCAIFLVTMIQLCMVFFLFSTRLDGV
jgi:hypothetical protein